MTIDQIIESLNRTPKHATTIYSGFCTNCGEWYYTYARAMSGWCSRKCGHYKGGWLTSDGYRGASVEGKQFREHRLVVENSIGRKLLHDEEVHHKDGNKLNNDLSNLQVLSKVDHAKLHAHNISRS